MIKSNPDNTNEIIILSSGEKINPQEIESVYVKNPYVKEVYVFLSSVLEEQRDNLSALILPDYDFFKSKGITQIKDKIKWEIENISRTIPPHKRIQKYTVVTESLPRNELGKLDRKKIRERYLDLISQKSLSGAETKTQILPQDKELLASPTCRKALEYLAQKLKRKINLDDHLEINLGLDSLEQITLLLEFQKLLNIRLDESEFFGVLTVRDVLNKLMDAIPLKLQKEVVLDWKDTLKFPLKPEARESIVIQQSFLMKLVNLLLAILLKTISRAFFLLEVKEKSKLPKSGSFILCANHASYLDGPLLASSLNFPLILKAYFLGYAMYFRHPLISWSKKLFRLVPIDTATNLIDSLRVCSYILSNAKVLCIFPEGVRSMDGEVKEFKRGVGVLVKELDVPIIPVYIHGTFKSWPPYRILPRPGKVKIVFGEKISFRKLSERKEEDVDIYKNIADNLRQEVLKLQKSLETK